MSHRKHGAAYTNNGAELDEELNRRYTMHTLERNETFKNDEIHGAVKESTKTQ